jgi:DNA-binding transcriptional regulator YiaG
MDSVLQFTRYCTRYPCTFSSRVRTVQDWEQGRREPSGPAKTLLRIAEQHPEVFGQLA